MSGRTGYGNLSAQEKVVIGTSRTHMLTTGTAARDRREAPWNLLLLGLGSLE